MKMLPVQLSLNPPLGLWSDVLWRCPPAPPSQLAELKTQLPASLPSDPRLWGREDVSVFLRFCEREFDLPAVDYDLFQMNGKALCLLTRADFGHRCPGAGDVLHNVLQMLIIESHMMQWHLPNSPVTPTSRYPLSPHSHPPTPTWPPITPTESQFHNAATTAHNMHHFMAPNSVTLSPPPSVDSQASSPPQSNQEQQQQHQQQHHNVSTVSRSSNSSSTSSSNGSSNGSAFNGSTVSVHSSTSSNGSSNGSGSNGNCHGFTLGSPHNLASMKSNNNSDSEEESAYAADSAAGAKIVANRTTVSQYNASPPTTPILKDMPQLLSQQLQNSFVNSWSQSQHSVQQHQQQQQPSKGQQSQHERKSPQLGSGSVSAPTTPSFMQPVKREFFPDNYKLPVKREFFPDSPEPNTNGRLLWDFLQQLLNDREQKYSDLIAWKCRDTGVFKIVDPAGLAKLWGIQKNHLSMNYDKMSRALRYYYRVNILRKVQGERHCYQFLRNPSELKNIKNISLLRQSLGNQQTTANNQPTSNNNQNNNNNINTNNNNNNNNNNTTANQQQQQTQSQHHQQSSINNNNNNSNTISNNNNVNNNPPQSPNWQHHGNQRPSSRMNLPALSQSAAAAAAVAAAAAAYGPSPSSPLFMHAINGAFHYLSSSAAAGGPPPNSPAALPSTPSEKFQFNAFKMEDVSSSNNVAMQSANGSANNEEMKPTDLSVSGGSEKRPYASSSTNEDCYPLIRNADGLTTIKLIRYNDNNDVPSVKCETAPVSPKQKTMQDGKAENQITSTQPAPVPMESENSMQHSGEVHYANHAAAAALIPTDLSKQMQHDDDYDS